VIPPSEPEPGNEALPTPAVVPTPAPEPECADNVAGANIGGTSA
jgi:hypothetical protein